jgi:hypothetical protein
MGVTTNLINKPFNPRAQDQSPKGYNRAALYSGKALDFDGVNDEVNIGAISGSFTDYTLSWYVQTSTTQNFSSIFTNENSEADWYITSAGQLRVYSGAGDETTTLEPLNDGKLKHVVASISGDQLSVYINGALGQTISYSRTSAFTINASRIGRLYNGGYPYDGLIAGFKIFNTALTASQVADLYNNPEKVVPTGVDNTALKLWLPMMEGAGTTAYDGSAPLTDYVTNGDFSDGTNNWTASNATLSVENGALKITSTGGNRPQGYQTITGLTTGRKYLLSAVARVGTTSYNMEIEISGIGASGSYNKTTNSTDTYIYTEFTAGSTTHVIQAKIDDSSVAAGETGYFDDIKLLDLGNYGTISGATWTNGIGAPVSQTSVIDWNKWYLDHTNEVLIPQGLTSGRDLLGNLFENVRKQGALNLDGNSWAEVHDNESLDITSAISVEAWVYFDGAASRGILGRWYSSISDRSYLLLTEDATNIRFYVYTSATSFIETGDALTTNNWYHVVGTYDGANQKIYINGSESANKGLSGNIQTSSEALEIGRYFDQITGRGLTNQIAQPRIYNRALTASEIQQNYNAGKNTYTN